MTSHEISESEQAEILLRAEAASPGRWTSIIEGRNHSSGSSFIQVGEGNERGPDLEVSGASDADLDFIAGARQNVPRLVAEVRRLQDLLKQALGAV